MTIRIGLVDDHPVVLEGLEAALGGIPDLAVADRGGTVGDARRLLARDDLDVVLLDVRLADGSSLEALREREANGGPAVIVLSSFRTAQYVAAAVRFGAQGFLLKTAPMDEVAAAIRTAASGGTWFSADQLRAATRDAVSLTAREREVVALVLDGCSNDEIGVRLGMKRKTVEAHLSRMFLRFGVMSRLELGLRAEREGWLDLVPESGQRGRAASPASDEPGRSG
jgi:DNA-binding NarL/FixJ family response regulator